MYKPGDLIKTRNEIPELESDRRGETIGIAFWIAEDTIGEIVSQVSYANYMFVVWWPTLQKYTLVAASRIKPV